MDNDIFYLSMHLLFFYLCWNNKKMSQQQPCLPIGNNNSSSSSSNNKRKRRRWKRGGGGGGGQRRNHNENENVDDEGKEKVEDEIVVFDDIESMDATEYLTRVSKQAKKLPDVFVNNAESSTSKKKSKKKQNEHEHFIPIDGSAASLHYLISMKASLTPVPTIHHLPKNSDQWIQTTIQNFDKLKQYLLNCWLNGVGGKQTTDRIKLPPMKDRTGWNIFCVGKDDAQGNFGSYYDDDDDDNNNKGHNNKEGDDAVVDEWQQNIPEHGYKPTTRLILQMDQVLVRRVLSHLAYYYCTSSSSWPPLNISSSSSSQQRCFSWLYALLARLEKPIHREDAAILFSILKQLTIERSKLIINVSDNDDDDGNNNNNNNKSSKNIEESLAKLNCLIVIIGIYFEQGGTAVMKCTTAT